ncbi:hypothetical protein D9M68_946130 [compost metagenome]
MALEVRLVDGDVLQGLDPLLRLELQHAVDQQERVPVRQQLEDLADIDFGRAHDDFSLVL